MRKLLLLVIAVSFVVKAVAQNELRNSVGMDVALEWITNGNYDAGTYPVKSFINKKMSLQYRCYVYERAYVEPGLSFYTMNYDYFKSTGSGISVDSNTPGNGKYRYSNYVLDEIGGAFFAKIGVNIPVAEKLSMDLYIVPDYRLAIECEGKSDADLIDEGVFKREYFMLGAGTALNYSKFFVNLRCGTYLTDRYLKKSTADKPVCLTLGLGYRF